MSLTNKFLLFGILTCLFFTQIDLFAAGGSGKNVAKVILIRGKVLSKMKGQKVVKLVKGQSLSEGAIVQTKKKSFVKLLFADKSQMNLGPSSKMVISKFPRKKAGIITLLNGTLRSKVSKNYMEKDKSKSKLFIRTKTAAMGVRGTDFRVDYGKAKQVTSLVTFSGVVAMAQIEKGISRAELFKQDALEKIVSSDKAVIVKKGEYSGAGGDNSKATTPVKVPAIQLHKLKEETEVPEARGPASSGKGEHRAPPPGTKPPGEDPMEGEPPVVLIPGDTDPKPPFDPEPLPPSICTYDPCYCYGICPPDLKQNPTTRTKINIIVR